ncbi:MAG: PilZ domain-containing protein [Oleiphilaceae bacterium]|nr:PilZ domain-containing protein [Oleiphilaceae bacterium]
MSKPIKTIDELANRRQYFRLDDQVSVEWALIDDGQSPGEFFDLNPEFGLISEFQLLDVESKHLLRTLTDKDKNLGQFLRVLNRKLDSLARVIALSHADTAKDTIQSVNLSEGGIAFPADQHLNTDQKVALKLILLPSYSGLLLAGKVLSCEGEQPPYTLHVQFSDISEAHQQLIARHIMRKQSQGKHPS